MSRAQAHFASTGPLTHTVSDGSNSNGTATAMANLVNNPPTANPDSFMVAEDSGATALPVLLNDSTAPDTGETLTVTSVTQPAAGGTVTLSGGEVRFTPDPNFNGTVTFTYTVSDGNGGTATATVTVTVTPENDPPTANDNSFTIAEDGAATALEVLDNDTTAPDTGETPTVTSVTQPANGTVTLVGGVVFFTPPANFNGTTSFTYTINDGNGGTATATVTVTVTPVNDPPTAVNDMLTVAEDSGATVVAVLANDSIAPDTGETLTVTAFTPPANGTVTLVGGVVRFTPAANFNGTTSFTYTINDGNGGTATATVSVTMTPENDPPTAVNDTLTVAEDSGATVVNVLANDSIAPDTGETPTVTAVTQPTNGTVTLVGGVVRFTPAANFNGTTSFMYTVSDGNGGTATATVTVTVTAVNDPPTANDDAFTVAEDSTNNVLEVLANDSIAPDTGETPTVTSMTQPATGGTVALTGGLVVFTSVANFNGTTSFTYTINDGNGGTATATVSVTVTPMNDPPTAVNDTLTVAEDSGATVVAVLANDSIAPDTGETLTVTAVTQPANGSATFTATGVTFTPALNFFGSTSFTYTVSDGNGGTATAMVTVMVTPENDPPTAMDDSFTIAEGSAATAQDVLANDTPAPDTGETLTVTEVTQPANGIATLGGGIVSYQPNANFHGTDTFTYTVSDGNGLTNTATVTMTVTPVNNPPNAVEDTLTVAEDSAATVVDVLGNDSTAPDTGETLTVTAVTQPTSGTVTLVGEEVRFTPAANFNGTTSFTYTISDGNGGSDAATVTVTVTPVNDPPDAVNDRLAVAENSTSTVVDVLVNDSTAPDIGETLTVIAVDQPAFGTVTLLGGVVRYRPPTGFTGTDMFTYTVSDGNSDTSTATVVVNIMPSGTGGWSTTGPLATSRIWHTATLLPSGKVLVTGGDDIIGGGLLASTELYDPDTGVWSAMGDMAAERVQHTATLLPSGKVLVTGGAAGGGSPDNAELYDPGSGTWSPTDSMSTARLSHTATLLPSGKVLVTGGYGWSNAIPSAEVYDPGTGAWSLTDSMAAGRWQHTATLLLSGKVLVTGGADSTGLPVASAEVYNPDTGRWTFTGDMAADRWHHTATPLPSGKILVTGGADSTGLPVASAEVYDPDTGGWSSTGSMATARLGHTATLLPSGRVLVIGGWDSSNSLASAEVYDPDTGVWSSTGDMATGRAQPTATLLPSGQVLVTGGGIDPRLRAEVYREFIPPAAPVVVAPANGSTISDSTPTYSGTADADSTVTVTVDGVAMGDTTAGTTGHWSITPPTRLVDGPHTVKATAANTGGTSPDSNANTFTVAGDPSTGGWSTTGALVMARTGHTATVLLSRKVLVTGGEGPSGSLATAEVYDPAMGGWSTTGALATARRNHSATVLPSGKVLVTGGEGPSGLLASAELYDPATGTWSPTGALATARIGHMTTVLPSGKVLVTGGQDSSGSLASAELYDPSTGTWSPTGSLTTARRNHSATLLPSGKVLVTGGEGSSGPVTSSEMYDPDAGTWSTTSSLATARRNHSATLLPSGKVLVTGGEGSSGLLASTELYNPATESWSTTGALATARRNPSAVLLPSGRVLVAGGEGPGGALASTEVYAPSTEVWSPTGLLTTARQGHTATVLPSGHVLITGGRDAGGLLLGGVEMYEAVGASRSTAPLPEARTDFMTVLLPNGLVMVMGGSDSSGALASARLYNPVTGLWTNAANMGTPRSAATATLLPTGQVLVTGGRAVSSRGLQAQSADEGAVLATAELFDPKNNTWSSARSLREARYSHSALLLSTGQVLVTGGLGANDTLRSSAEVYDVATDTWLEAGSMNVPRRQHMVAQLPTGQVLVAGGRNAGGDPLASAEVYDPQERKWTVTAPMSTARAASTAVPLPTSQVMVVGGTDDHGSLSSAEVYEPVGRRWISAKPLNTPRKSHTALLLPTGRVLIMGGANGGSVLDSVEVYDTVLDRWEVMERLIGPREDSVTVMLPTGQVLLLGGEDLIGPLENTELYDEFGPPEPLRPVVDPLSPQKPGAPLTVRGRNFKAPPGGSSRVRLQLAPKGALRDLPEAERSDTSVQVSLAGVPDGIHLLFVMVNDIAGGRVVQVDQKPPPAPEVKAFTQTPPTLSGTAEPYSTVQVFVDDREQGTAEANVRGEWSLQLTTTLEDGTYSALAAATDFVGNPGPRSMPYSFTVDTQAPEAPVVDPLGAIIKDSRPTLSGRAEPRSTVTVFMDEQEMGTAVADTEGFWSFTVRRTLGDEVHTASATARDPAGNTSPASVAITFNVDTQAPTAPEVLTPEEGAVMDLPTVTTSGKTEPGSLVRVFLDGQEKGTVKADTVGAWSLTFDTGVENGERTLTATAEDVAGNISPPSAGRTFTVGRHSVDPGGCSGCAASPGESSLVLLGLAVLRRLLTRRRSTRA